MIFNYLNALINVLLKPLKVRQTPIHIQVEPTTFCNLDCESCARSKYLEHAKHLTPEKFQRILEQIRPLKISLSGGGEPLMNPHLFELIRLAKTYGCSINTTTNGTLLSPENCEQLIQSELDLIKISIDAATPETHQKNRGDGIFSLVLEGVQTLVDAKRRLGAKTPFIRFNYVVFKNNYHEMIPVIELAHKLGVNAIYFQPLDLTGIEERQEELVGDLTYEKLRQSIITAMQVSQRLQVHTNLHDMRKKLPLYWRKYQIKPWENDFTRRCVFPWFSTHITLEGSVRPCCSCLQDYTTLGNIFQDDIHDVWNSERYQHFRKDIREGKRPFAICKNCVPQTVGDLIRYSKILPGFLR